MLSAASARRWPGFCRLLIPPSARAPRSGASFCLRRARRGVGQRLPARPAGQARPWASLGSRVLLTRACPAQPSKANPSAASGGGSPCTRGLSCAGAAPRVPWRRQIPGRFHGGAAGLRSRSRGREPWHRTPGGYALPEKCHHPADSVTSPCADLRKHP